MVSSHAVLSAAGQKSRKKLPTKAATDNHLRADKDNQGNLANARRNFFGDADTGGFDALPTSRYETVEKSDGRIDTRDAPWRAERCRLLRRRWKTLTGVGMKAHRREIDGKTSAKRAWYTRSTGVANAEMFTKSARRHRGIDDRLR